MDQEYERHFEAENAAIETADKWWDDLRARSVGSIDIPEWGYIWVGVMLRRWIEKNPKGLKQYRTLSSWKKLIYAQHDHDPDTYDLSWSQNYPVDAFFREPNGPWLLLNNILEKKDWAIGQVATLDQDIEFARAKQSKRIAEERRLRDQADHIRETRSP